MKSIASGLSRRFFLQAAAAAGLAGGFGLRSRVFAADKIRPTARSALIVVDVQNCFIDGGTLPVKGGAEVVPVINKLAAAFENVVVTQDWHTPDHTSFASTHSGKKPFDMAQLPYGPQVLWPDHCVQGTDGAALSKDLSIPQTGLVIRKGFHRDVDSYSALGGRRDHDRAGLSQGAALQCSSAADFWLDGHGRAGFGLRDRERNARHRPKRTLAPPETDDGCY